MEAHENFVIYRPGGARVAAIHDGELRREFTNIETAEAIAVSQWNGEDLTIVRRTCVPVARVTGTMQVVTEEI